jgi:hypothetical protein
MLLMPFGIPILGGTMVILGGSATGNRVFAAFRRILLAQARRLPTERRVRGVGVLLVVRDRPAR